MRCKLAWSTALGLVDRTVLLFTGLADVVRAGVHASHLRGCQLRHAHSLFGVVGSLSLAQRHHVHRPPRLDGVLDALENASVTFYEVYGVSYACLVVHDVRPGLVRITFQISVGLLVSRVAVELLSR